MNKPWYFLPFIFVYKVVFFILLLPFNVIKFIVEYIPYVGYYFYKYVIMNVIKGMGMLCIAVYKAISFVIQKVFTLLIKFITLLSYLFYRFTLLLKKACIFLFHAATYFFEGIFTGVFIITRFFRKLGIYCGIGIASLFVWLKSTLKSGTSYAGTGLMTCFLLVTNFLKTTIYHFGFGIYAFLILIKNILKTIIYHFGYGIFAFLFFIYHILKYIVVILYSIVKFVCIGLYTVLYTIKSPLYRSYLTAHARNQEKKLLRKKAREEKAEKDRLLKLKKKEEAELRKQKALAEKEAKKSKDGIIQTENEYKNENVIIEKKSFKQTLRKIGLAILHAPKNLLLAIKNKIKNSIFLKAHRNTREMERQALLINFDGEDAVKSDKKVLYEYVAKNAEGKVVKDYFEAFSKVEVHSYLLSEGYEVYSIKTSKWITFLHGRSSVNHVKIKIKDLIFFITQLSTYIKAGIPLAEALKILSRQYKKPAYKKIFSAIIYDLTMGESFSTALEKQGNAFPKLLINMIKTSEMTGELPEALDDMESYYTEADKTRKQMITAMMYPSMVFVFASAVIVFILIWVIPQFVAIYESMDASKIPAFTVFIIKVSAFLKKYLIWLLLGVGIFAGVMVYLYRKVKLFRSVMQWLAMHFPVFGKVIIYNEVTMFTKTFSSLLKHNVFITNSMEILNKITNNEIYKMLILDTITNIAHGDKISLAFKDHWAFPIPAYEMLVTGEKTGQLPDMMAKVSTYYQEMHAQSVTRIKTFIEPALIIFLTVMVGIIILAIILPMFGMYSMIG
ncbi:MAG: type II secretion system F family protein [Bacilli bacterium]|nr:type II secretion system F family protein [Bacilli bacterium]